MYILKICLAFGLMAFAMSCGNNMDSAAADPLEFEWNAINISGGVAGYSYDFAIGDYTWSFADDELIRTMHIQPIYFIVPTRDTFDYVIVEDSGKEYLELDGNNFGELEYKGDSLIIDTNGYPGGSGADGYAYVLVK